MLQILFREERALGINWLGHAKYLTYHKLFIIWRPLKCKKRSKIDYVSYSNTSIMLFKSTTKSVQVLSTIW
jgi:hypothetical protein